VLRDVTFPEFGVLSAVLSVAIVGGEVPAGYVGDRYGRKGSLALSVVLSVLSLLGFVVARGFVPYLLFYVLRALALAFASGSADAWLYELLEEYLSTDAYTRIRGRGASVMRWTSVATTIAGGGLYVLNPSYPFLASAALSALGLAVLWSMPASSVVADDRPGAVSRGGSGDTDVTDEPNGAGTDAGARTGPRESLAVARRGLTAPSLRWLVSYAGLFFAVVRAGESYIQPVARAAVRGRLDALAGDALRTGLPLGVLLGLLYASFAAVSATASYYAGDVEARLGLTRTLLIRPPRDRRPARCPPVRPAARLPHVRRPEGVSRPVVPDGVWPAQRRLGVDGQGDGARRVLDAVPVDEGSARARCRRRGRRTGADRGDRGTGRDVPRRRRRCVARRRADDDRQRRDGVRLALPSSTRPPRRWA
jgi:MFS family permease